MALIIFHNNVSVSAHSQFLHEEYYLLSLIAFGYPQSLEWLIVAIFLYQTLDLFVQLCRERRYPYVRLDGATSISKRQKLVNQFNDLSRVHKICSVPWITFTIYQYIWNYGFGRMSSSFYLVARQVVVGLIWSEEIAWFSLTLIGTLPTISRLISMHLLFHHLLKVLLLWSHLCDLLPSVKAAARVWRDGQKKRVYIYRFLSTGSIEEKVANVESCIQLFFLIAFHYVVKGWWFFCC